MSEEVKKEEQAVAQTKAELLAALQNDFATAVNKVYLNSVDKEFAFREISVEEQKSLTRMMSANESRKDIIYDAQCAIINKASLTPGFDIYQFSDFDRLKLLLSLYQENMFQNQVKFTCEECGTENAYQIDFANTIAKLDAYKLEKKTFEYENRNFKYVFEIEYPTVKLVSRFHQSYCAKHGGRPVKREKKLPPQLQKFAKGSKAGEGETHPDDDQKKGVAKKKQPPPLPARKKAEQGDEK